jgi:hypothetical protein
VEKGDNVVMKNYKGKVVGFIKKEINNRKNKNY